VAVPPEILKEIPEAEYDEWENILINSGRTT
jgi:hypothetical protein